VARRREEEGGGKRRRMIDGLILLRWEAATRGAK